MSGIELKTRREALGLKVYELATEFGVPPSSVYRWENGTTPLHGLTAIGADTLLRRLERRRQQRGAPGGET